MKLFLIYVITLLALEYSSRSIAQDHAIALPGTTSDRVNIDASNQTATANRKEQENNTAEEDDSLYRGSTKETLENGAMIRDEGALHFKSHGKEKIQEVDSKNLHSSGTDSKFQSSLLHSSVTSIADIGDKTEKANQADQPDEERGANYQSDPRFRTKRLIFTPEKTDESKKKESTEPKADSSPSPSPSPTASATPSSR